MQASPPECIAIVGSRKFRDLGRVKAYVDALPDASIVVSGGAIGVDRTAERAAKDRGLGVISIRPYSFEAMSGRQEYAYKAVWNAEGADTAFTRDANKKQGMWFPSFRQAAFSRNGEIVRVADRVVAFWDGESNGTQNAIGHAKTQHKPYEVIS